MIVSLVSELQISVIFSRFLELLLISLFNSPNVIGLNWSLLQPGEGWVFLLEDSVLLGLHNEPFLDSSEVLSSTVLSSELALLCILTDSSLKPWYSVFLG